MKKKKTHRESENGAGQERGVGRGRYPISYTTDNEQPKEELLLMMTSHLLRCLDSAVYCWFPGKTAPMQSS